MTPKAATMAVTLPAPTANGYQKVSCLSLLCSAMNSRVSATNL